MDVIFVDFTREKSLKYSTHRLKWIRKNLYCSFRQKLPKFLRGVSELPDLTELLIVDN